MQNDKTKAEKQISSLFRGNIATIAISGSLKSLGNIFGSFLPLYFVRILGGDALTLGFFASMASIFQFFTIPFGGFLADYYGRKKVLAFAVFYGAFFPLLFAVVSDWRIFGLLTIIVTFTAIANPAQHAVVVDSLPPNMRASGIAYVQVVSSLPSAVAPLVGGWLIENYGLENGFKLACLYSTIFSFASAIALTAFLRETLLQTQKTKPKLSVQNTFAGLTRLIFLIPKSLKALLAAYALVAFANGAVGQFFILYAYEIIKLGVGEWALIVSIQSFSACVLKIPGGWLSDKFGKRKVMVASLLTCAPTAILFALSRSFLQALAAALLLVITGIYYAPAHEALQADLTPRALRGRVSALWNISTAISSALGALLGGFTFQNISPAAPFYVFTLVEFAALALILGIVREPVVKED
ncbi:MAG: MFS transporter [Candidatus Bathyarchaeia archaeon]